MAIDEQRGVSKLKSWQQRGKSISKSNALLDVGLSPYQGSLASANQIGRAHPIGHGRTSLIW